MSRAEFESAWEGTVITTKQHGGALDISQEAQKQIKGAWFPLIAAISSFFAFVFEAVTFIVTSIAALVSTFVTQVVPQALNWLATTFFASVKDVLFTVGRALFQGIKWVGTTLYKGFTSFIKKPFANIFGAQAAPGAANSTITSTILKNATHIAIDYSVNKGLEELGVNDEVSSLLGAFVTGNVVGGFTETGFSMKEAFATGVQAAAFEGINQVAVREGLDPTLAQIAALTGSTLTRNLFFDNGMTDIFSEIKGLAPNVAQELTMWGVRQIGDDLGIDPRISQLAGMGVSTTVGGIVTEADNATLLRGLQEGLKKGITHIGFELLGEELGLDMLDTAVTSRVFVALVDGILNPLKTTSAAIFDAFEESTFNIFSFGGYGDDAYSHSLYMSKVMEFSQITQSQGIEFALETYASSIFQRDAIEDIYRQGGISDILLNNARYVQINGIDLKEIDINSKNKIYLDPLTEEYKGRMIGESYLEMGTYGIGTQGEVRLIEGWAQLKLNDDFTTILKIVNGEAVKYSIVNSNSEEQITISKVIFGHGGEFESVVVENKVTGAKMEIEGDHIKVDIPTGDDQLFTLEGHDVSVVEPESMFSVLVHIISNGINNRGMGAPYYVQGWARDLEVAGVPMDSVFLDSLFEQGTHVRDVGMWVMDVILGTDVVTNELIAKANEKFLNEGGIPNGNGRLIVAYSGSCNPWMKALDRVNYGVTTFMAIGGPRVSSRIGDANPIERVIVITGEDDWVGKLFAGGEAFTNAANQYNIILEGVGHMYGYDPNNPSPDPMEVKASKFIARIVLHHNDDEWLEDYLRNFEITEGNYLVNLDEID